MTDQPNATRGDLLQLEADLTTTLNSETLLAEAPQFRSLVDLSMKLLGLRDEDVAGRLPVSRSTVNRWRHGESIPLPMARKPVYKLFLRRVAKALASTATESKEEPLHEAPLRVTFFSPDEVTQSVEIGDETIRCAGGNAVTYVPRPFDPSTLGRISRTDLEIVRHVCEGLIAGQRHDVGSMTLEELTHHGALQGLWKEICQPQVLLTFVQALDAAWLKSQETLESSATQKIAQSVADLMAHADSRDRWTRNLLLCIAECIATSGSAAGAAGAVKDIAARKVELRKEP